MTPEEIAAEAQARHDCGSKSDQHRPLSDGYERVGVVGEARFAKEFGLTVDTKPGSDRGIDFKTPAGRGIDVKSSRNPDYLLVERGKTRAEVYVLAHYDDATDSARLVGWCEKPAVLKHKPRAYPRHVVNHVVPASELRPISELKRLMGVTAAPHPRAVYVQDDAKIPGTNNSAKLPPIEGYYCKRFRHIWQDLEDADRCCTTHERVYSKLDGCFIWRPLS